MGFGSKG